MFRDASPLIALNPPALHSGIAVSDIDGDGRFEFVVAGTNGPNRILRWASNQLRDCIVPDLADISRDAVGVAVGDIDGDGREELYVLNSNRADRLFDVQADGRWVDLLSHVDDRSIHNRSAGRNVAAIDRRGVGRYGFFIANYGCAMRLYELGRDGSLADLAPSLGLAMIGGGRGVLTLPVFSEHPDVFCVNEQGPNFAFRNRRNGTFAECAGELGLTDPQEHARGVTAFDFGDGKRFGLCWGNWDGPHRVMLPRENGTWKDHATPGLAFPSAVRTVIAADFDNDGHDELFFHNMGEANRLFRVAPNGTPDITMLDPGEALDPDGFGTGAAVCDIDGDGVLELLISRGEHGAQPLGLYKSRMAEGNGFLRVRPLTRFGAPARGAVVRAEANGRVRVKGVCGGSGYLCQMEPVAHFGFGPAGRAERVQVTWPDGASVVLLNPGSNRTITVPYPRG